MTVEVDYVSKRSSSKLSRAVATGAPHEIASKEKDQSESPAKKAARDNDIRYQTEPWIGAETAPSLHLEMSVVHGIKHSARAQ